MSDLSSLPSSPETSANPAVPAAPSSALHDAAETARSLARQAPAAFERAIHEAEVLDRIPGRSVTLAGLGIVAVAIALSVLPAFSGVGLVWSVVMLALGAVVAVAELRAAGVSVPVRLPAALRHPLIPPAYAALVAVHAFQLLRLETVPALWLGAAVLLCWDQHRKTVLAPGGFGQHFDPRRAWQGYRRNVVLGVGVCLASLFLTWGQTSGYFSGGYSYNYAYRSNSSGASGYAYGYDYNPTQYYWPGFELSGRSQPLVLFAEAALLALLLLCALRPGDRYARGARLIGLPLAAFLGVFWLLASKDALGSLVFLAGLGTLGFGLFRLSRGEEEGRWDAAHLSARARAAVDARRGGA